MERILDKKLLADAATEAGLAVLPTWEPRSLSDVVALAPTLMYPILIKPRTHLHRVHNDKGRIACSDEELARNFLAYVSRENGGDAAAVVSTGRLPLLQHFVAIGAEGVYSVSGFIDETGELFVTRHARKVFQRSEPAGVGVCFDSLPADPELSEAVHRFCRHLGYFGIFEVEFVRFRGRWAVIDFNPRLFNQAAMDAYRGMPLALFAYLDAAGNTAELREAIAIARDEDQDRTAVFQDSFTLQAILIAKALSRRTSRAETGYWRDWMRQNSSRSVDFALDKTDLMPGIVHALSDTILGLKALRRFFRSTAPISSGREPKAITVSH
jgi:predicted ATP-grasp superfamily ATP-dependent carboligase